MLLWLAVVAVLASARGRFLHGRPSEGFTGKLIKHHEAELRRQGVQLPPDQWFVRMQRRYLRD